EQRLCDGVCRVSRRLLADLAERSLEQDIVRVFLRRLEELTEAERRSLAARSEVTFATAFSLDPEQRHTVTEALARYAIPAPRFVERPGLIAGLVLEADGHQVAWSVTDYLDDLAEQVLEPPENGRG
ncbi:MAG: hypothetical protein R3202_11535, partial [Candidatus Competibacterales bacterium]|nr:hypothetical protein [Candidatus Competibacterales bacterium]